MTKRSSKTILVFFALGLLSCALCVKQAQAVPITGAITFAGGVTLDQPSVNNATEVTSWVSPTVFSASGSFAAFVTTGDSVTFTPLWFFNSPAIPAFWTVDGFTFSETASFVVSQGGGFVNVVGTGTISGNGFGPTTAIWTFTAQDPSAGGVFSFSGSSQGTPDGGATVLLLGLGLVGIEGIRRKLMRAKS
jgi:hypothetical protein